MESRGIGESNELRGGNFRESLQILQSKIIWRYKVIPGHKVLDRRRRMDNDMVRHVTPC